MTDRSTMIRDFLTANGWQNADYCPMTADASFRSYVRLSDATKLPQTAILMNAPPETNNPVSDFTLIAEELITYGYSAPKIYAGNNRDGLLLIEDLGVDLFAHLCADNLDREHQLYGAAVDLLADLASRTAPSKLAPYSTEICLREAMLLPEWYMPAATGGPVCATQRAIFSELITRACQTIPTAPPVFVYRDFHAENLLWLPDRAGLARIGLLDFQDALSGHPAYDLVSLLEDARRDTNPVLRTAMIQRYLQATGAHSEDFHLAYCTLGAQRNLKILGIFARLGLRDGKHGYIDMMPRVWTHLMRDLSHPALADLKAWVGENVPPPTAETVARVKGCSDAP